jgi:hypothetical protein
VRFVVDKVALGGFFLECFGFLLSVSFHLSSVLIFVYQKDKRTKFGSLPINGTVSEVGVRCMGRRLRFTLKLKVRVLSIRCMSYVITVKTQIMLKAVRFFITANMSVICELRTESRNALQMNFILQRDKEKPCHMYKANACCIIS